MSKPARPASYDAKDVFFNALRFNATCEYLLQIDPGGPLGRLANTVVLPQLALSALTLELLLKTLTALQNGAPIPQTHNLGALFRNLDRNTRQLIEDRWAPILTVSLPRWEYARRTTSSGATTIPSTLDAMLIEASHAFEQFRYSFESSPRALPNYYVDQLRQVLIAVILAKRPDWKPVGGAKPVAFPWPDNLRGT